MDDYVVFARMKFAKDPTQEPFACFAQAISEADALVEFLNRMFCEGINFKQILGQEFALRSAAESFKFEIIRIKGEFEKYKEFLERISETEDRLKRLFFLNFAGEHLSLLSQDNLPHFLRFISRDIRLSRLHLDGQIEGSSDTAQKMQVLNQVWELNRDSLSQSMAIGAPKFVLQPRKIHFTRIPPAKIHNYLVYFYEALAGQRLECNQVFFCDESTSWVDLKCTSQP